MFNKQRSPVGRCVFTLAILLIGFLGGRTAGAQEQWHRWEKELRTARDYHQITVNGILERDNPYRKLRLSVTYQPISCANPSDFWCKSFSTFGFWDGGRVFKIRGSFPAGTWQYTVSCAGTSGGLNCASGDAVLNQTGTFTIVNSNPSEDALFERGFVRPSTNSGLKYLTYGDGQAPFFWRADTVWLPANVANIDDAAGWSTFLSNRKAKGFNTLMMGVVPDGDNATNATTKLWDDVPQPDAGCTGSAWPKPCSRWRAEFWKKFEDKINAANEAGFLVVLIGLMDPQGNAQGANLYPEQAGAVTFARNLAARLAGNHVIYSPSFDDRLSNTRALMDAVGNELKTAAPRHLLTAHLAGSSSICDYYEMHNTVKHPWHQLHIFQSGHALNMTGCNSGEDQYECAVRRAREHPDNLSPLPTAAPSCADPAPTSANVKPNANGEAAYDYFYTTAPTQSFDSPYGVRHSGYNSALNGAFGVTLGVKGVWDWVDVSSTTLESDGSKHMKILGDRFNLGPWQMLQRRSPRIKNQPAATEQDKMMTMAATLASDFAMIYMPDDDFVRFDASFLTGFDCNNLGSSTWTLKWVNPRTGDDISTASCTNLSGDPTGATRSITRPACANANSNGPIGNCDWLLVLRKSQSLMASSLPQSGLDVWSAPTEDGSGWQIVGQAKGSADKSAQPFAITTSGAERRLKLPVAAQGPGGNFVVVWESEDDGHLHGIFLRRVDGQGRLLDREYPVNTTTEYDQTHPWAALDASGRGGVVTWTSYAQDGSSGGIFARLVNAGGVPYGPEIQVNEHTSGRQDFSKAAIDAQGNIFVAWTSDDQDGDAEGVFARRFDANGKPLGPELRVNTATAGGQWLTGVEPDAQGNVRVSWTSYAPDGGELGVLSQLFGADGAPVGGETLVVPPPAPEVGSE